MFKKTKMALLISCICSSSYAYVIESNFTIENKTDVPMVMVMEQPNKQDLQILQIPAHQTTKPLAMTNGDHGGLLYQTSTAPFKISSVDSDNKVYVQGRVVYYVGASLWNKYSFLNAITAADGVKVDPAYSCANGGYSTTFENKIVIDGTPDNGMQVTEFPVKVSCQGLKSSAMSHENQHYTPTCFDGKKSLFWRYFDGSICSHWNHTCQWVFGYTNGDDSFGISRTEEPTVLQIELDNAVGNSYCGTWQ